MVLPPVRTTLAGVILFAGLAGSFRCFPAEGKRPVDPAAVAASLTRSSERLWDSCSSPSENPGSRTLFSYALALCEAHARPERLERLFELATSMQDRDTNSRTYGNFRWYWRDPRVMDANAVDFCMRGGALLWLRHRDFIPPAARDRLRQILDAGIQGLLKHKVAESYSNIAIMNAGDLILLGEAIGDPTASAEGYARLDRVLRYTRQFGTHEFVSPTYTGVDLDGLGLIAAFCREDRGRAQARQLLELLWTDIALNWFEPAQRLAGANSRTYDYLQGRGYLDVALRFNGWLNPAKEPADPEVIYAALAQWPPPAALRSLSHQFPRRVRQSWGPEAWHSRTHYLLPDITLSTLASSYGGWMDMPLTLDLPAGAKPVRGYFIADARDDPYGKKKIPAGAHQKALHLNPLWAGAQLDSNALALVLYREKDIPTNALVLNSNFVMPLEADAFYSGLRPVRFQAGTPSRVQVRPGEPIALRKGAAAFALKICWSRGLDAADAATSLVYDGNDFGAVRLVVEHAPGTARVPPGKPLPGAVLWARIGTGLGDSRQFEAWLQAFASAHADVSVAPNWIEARAPVSGDPLRVGAAAPWSAPEIPDPLPSRAVLEYNDRDIGSEILKR